MVVAKAGGKGMWKSLVGTESQFCEVRTVLEILCTKCECIYYYQTMHLKMLTGLP